MSFLERNELASNYLFNRKMDLRYLCLHRACGDTYDGGVDLVWNGDSGLLHSRTDVRVQHLLGGLS